MRTIFIKEMIKTNTLNSFFFNRIKIKIENGHTFLLIPKCKNNKTGKISKKIKKYLETEGTNRIVLSQELQKIDYLKNCLYSENINILNGRFLFKCLTKQIIEYIAKINKINDFEISVLVNDFTPLNNKIITKIANRVKRINIITNNIGRLKRLEKLLYNEYGVLINTYNSKEKSLLKTSIIINLDFPEEILNKYKINSKAIIVNLNEKIEINNKKFNGININYFRIKMPKEYKIEGFNNEEVYESMVYDYSFKDIQKKIENDNIKIIGLIGNKGIIAKQEFCSIFLDK